MAPNAEYTVVARRYRPRQLADLIGQEHVASALSNAITAGRIAHAYLFTGARGVGKTSTARILAKCLNCANGPTVTPCDKCDACLGIAAGEDVDAIEIDGASNNKVDEARELRNNVGFRPTRSRYKIYIIDEVHMLSTAAFNALLKTLEEPPAHVKFILATTEVQKIPITILSRCQRFDFAHVPAAKLFEHLKKVVTAEGLMADDEALHLIARRAAGSVRDSQSLLDQMLAFAEGNLTAEKIHSLLGTAGDDRVADLVDAVLHGDAKSAVEQVAAAADRGLQLGEFLDQLIDYWRGLMIVQTAGVDFPDLPGTPAFKERVAAHAGAVTLDTVMAGLDVLTTTKMKARGSSHARVMLELCVIRLSRLGELLPVASLMEQIGSGTFTPPAKSPAPIRPPEASAAKKNGPPNPAQPATPTAITNANIESVWPSVLDALGGMRATRLAAAGPPAISGPNALLLRFPAGYSATQFADAAEEKSVEALRGAIRKVTGVDWFVKLEPPAATAEARPTAPAGSRKKELLSGPLGKFIADTLGGHLVSDPDPEFGRAVAAAESPPEPDEV